MERENVCNSQGNGVRTRCAAIVNHSAIVKNTTRSKFTTRSIFGTAGSFGMANEEVWAPLLCSMAQVLPFQEVKAFDESNLS